MNNQINISVIMPIYNSEKYLSKSLDSLFENQTFKEFEVIAINDGSTDNSLSILEKYQKKYENLRIINQENVGSYLARIRGIENAKGNYIIFMDSDDVLDKNFLKELYFSAKENNSDIAICGLKRIDSESNTVLSIEMCKHKEKIIDLDRDTEQMLEINTGLCNKIFKADLFKKIYKFNENPQVLEDMAFLMLIYLYVKKISFVSLPLYNYYIHSGSQINSVIYEKIKKVQKTLLEIKEYYNENNASKERKEVLSLMVFIHLNISMLYRLYSSVGKNEFYDIKRKIDNYMNQNFPEYKKSKYLSITYVLRHGFSNFKIMIIRLVYKLGLFKIFLVFYNFMINKLKIDIKW